MKLISTLAAIFASLSILTSAVPVPANDNALEERGAAADVGMEIFQAVFTGITQGIANDKIARGDFTQQMVSQLSSQRPSFNFVIVHPKHETKFTGTQGVDWYHDHREFDIKIGGTIGYEIYGFKSGEFTLKGDGGFLNWAFIGNVLKRDGNGGHVVFGTR